MILASPLHSAEVGDLPGVARTLLPLVTVDFGGGSTSIIHADAVQATDRPTFMALVAAAMVEDGGPSPQKLTYAEASTRRRAVLDSNGSSKRRD